MSTAVYEEQFQAASRNGGAEPAWLVPVRKAAFESFRETGFPSARDEEWRFTPLAPIASTAFVPAPAARVSDADIAPFYFGHPEWPRLVFVNGRYDAALSQLPALPDGVKLGSLAAAVSADPSLERHVARHAPISTSPFTALNTAFIKDGAYVHVPRGLVLEQPVTVLFVSTGDAADAVTHPRNLFIIEDGANASIVESYVTLAPGSRYFTNVVTEVVTGANAWVEHTRIQRESEHAYHVGRTHIEQAADSHYRSFTLAMGGAMARHNLDAHLNAPNVETLMYGLYLTRGEQVVDNHTAIFHDHPNCRSWEVYKGVLDGKSRAVFNGKVFVQPEAQKTDAKQTNRNLLLSKQARVDTKPQLEIFADDVKCTHGATVGQLDEVALFYARSRGIPQVEAMRLLTYAFAAEVVSEVALAPVRDELDRLLLERLGSLE
ncbi:MAG TPA: Fe-S cluster assembly protein SufD [Gemmatimonadales bacterium]|nr:Fe-S cluster assembly protein SufD [Gemmatimonadales bacterium]